MYLFFLLSVLFITSANASSIQPPLVNGTYQFSFENISLGGSEKMGLLGGNYLIDHYSWYSGLGVYGAVTGDRGGFFTGGLHLGKNQPLFRGYFFDANAFVGGGGGGSAPQGGGLMLRTALGLGKQITNNRYFLGLSRVYFPNGAIDSTQLTIAYSRQFTALHFPGWYSGSTLWERWADSALGKNKKYQQVSMEMLTYFPAAGVMGRNFGNYNSVLGMLGVRFSQRLNDVVWGEFETAGAMSGGIDGFAQVLGGISFKQPLTRRFSFNGGWLLGAAGGGNVDTGGGVITRVFTGVEVALFKQWSSYLQFGYATVLDGGFSANTINLNLVYSFNTFSHTQSFIKSSKPGYLNWRKLRIRPGLQKYTLYTHRSRKTAGQQDLDVDLTNLKLDAFMSSNWYLTGQALGAFAGEAGGYAVGLIGPGIQVNHYLGLELLVGVAGGGGIAVGSGKVLQPMINFELPYNERWSTELSAGYIKAFDDDLSAYVFNAGLVYRFSLPYQ